MRKTKQNFLLWTVFIIYFDLLFCKTYKRKLNAFDKSVKSTAELPPLSLSFLHFLRSTIRHCWELNPFLVFWKKISSKWVATSLNRHSPYNLAKLLKILTGMQFCAPLPIFFINSSSISLFHMSIEEPGITWCSH